MSSGSNLRLGWCSDEAALYAVERWHYSRSLPFPPRCRVGVWESGVFIGCVVFAHGASPHLVTPYGLAATEGAELSRVALGAHAAPVSRIIRIALRLLQKRNPGLRLVVSFADPAQGHVGGIYQAGGWLYAGLTSGHTLYICPDGRRRHDRMIKASGWWGFCGRWQRTYRPSECAAVRMPGKHRYLMPLDAEMRERLAPLALPYPKRPAKRPTSIDSDATAGRAGEGGANPTVGLFHRGV